MTHELSSHSRKKARIGIDLGGTKIEGILLDVSGKEIARKRIETEQGKGYEAILERIKGLCGELERQVPGQAVTLGIGTPGSLSVRTELLKNSNTLCLNGKPFKKDLEKILGRKVEIQNDANCFALAEALQGAGIGSKLVFGVIVGTGCGGGIVYEGKVLVGKQRIAGEWGHTVIDPLGPPCYCGKRGCVETLISGGGLEARYAETYGKKLSLREIMERYRSKEKNEIRFMEQFFTHFGRALGNLINILDPDKIVLGGGVSNMDELYTEGVAAVQKEVFNDECTTPIVRHALGDSAGVIGAALIGI